MITTDLEAIRSRFSNVETDRFIDLNPIGEK